MPSVSRAPTIPRKIRDIKPKRQLRNERSNDHDDEWWHNNIGEAQKKSSTALPGTFLRGEPESNESFGTRLRISRPKGSDESISQEESIDTENENAANRSNSSMLKQMWERFKLTPTRKKIKNFIAGMVLFTALKSIYFADLDDYQNLQKGLHYTYTNTKPSVSIKKMDSVLSSLRSNRDGVKSLSELLGDDYLGDKSERKIVSTPSKTMGFSDELGQSNKIMGNSITESVGLKSMYSDSFGSAGQKNYDSSNNGPNFGSSNNNNMQSASFNSYSSQPDGKIQSSFNSFSDPHQQTQTHNQLQHSSSFQQLPNPRNAHDSAGQSQGLRGQSMNMGHAFNSNLDNYRGKSMMSSAGSGALNSDQFLNAQNPLNKLQSNPIVDKDMRTGLQCASHGGPHSERECSELIYWRDIPSDASFTSPYYNPQIQESNIASFHKTKYLTFEMDGSGWNNIRLGFEGMVVLAHSMGRTLVMPPKRQIAHGMVSNLVLAEYCNVHVS